MKRVWFVCVIFAAYFLFLFNAGVADDLCLLVGEGPKTFTAPVVPPTRTTSSNRAYVALFRPTGGNFWEGNVIKLGLSMGNELVDASGNAATWSSGAFKDDLEPFWATKSWADPGKSNYVLHSSRNIYTYLGFSEDLTAFSNAFEKSNPNLSATLLGTPVHTPPEIIDFIRGADIFDDDDDGDTLENRGIIAGDVMHSQPLVIDYEGYLRVVYFGSNGGMLHAVKDSRREVPERDDGTEMWAFIPPDQLHRLKDIVEGDAHLYFIDSSPKAYIKDVNRNGIIELDVDSDGDGDVDDEDKDRVILVCGERKGGMSYFALDVTYPRRPVFLWRVSRVDDGSELNLPPNAGPDVIIPELGESWSEPQFGRVKSTADDVNNGTPVPVFFIGGGYSPDNSMGRAVIAVNVYNGSVVRKFVDLSDMDYSFPSSISAVDSNGNGFVDKVYVGDLGGQMWRFGRFTDAEGNPLGFPRSDENINNWTGQVLFRGGCAEASCTNGIDDNSNGVADEWRRFFYPPSVTLEVGFDLLFMGTGDMEDPCNAISSDRIYVVKDTQDSATLDESDLVDVTDSTAELPDLFVDRGWFIRLAPGEKVLAEGLVFNKAYYITTYLPFTDGGEARIYAMQYKTGICLLCLGGSDSARSVVIGEGIPSKLVMIITGAGQKLLVSSTAMNPGSQGESGGAGILAIEPAIPSVNFFYLWWREL